MVRAALVIDNLSRNTSIDDVSGKGYLRTTIPVPLLAKSVGFQQKDMKKLETMQMGMASYLDGTSIGKQGNRNDGNRSKKSRKRDASSLQPDTATTSSSITSKPTNLI